MLTVLSSVLGFKTFMVSGGCWWEDRLLYFNVILNYLDLRQRFRLTFGLELDKNNNNASEMKYLIRPHSHLIEYKLAEYLII